MYIFEKKNGWSPFYSRLETAKAAAKRHGAKRIYQFDIKPKSKRK